MPTNHTHNDTANDTPNDTPNDTANDTANRPKYRGCKYINDTPNDTANDTHNDTASGTPLYINNNNNKNFFHARGSAGIRMYAYTRDTHNTHTRTYMRARATLGQRPKLATCSNMQPEGQMLRKVQKSCKKVWRFRDKDVPLPPELNF